MDETHALLAHLVQTKSIERVLAPITAQVSQLIILNEAYEEGDRDAFPDDLVPSASIVTRSTEGLVDAAKRLVADSNDEELQREMPRACDLLNISAQGLIAATQRVHIENFSRQSRRHLIRAAKDVLEGTLKVLLVSDDAEVRKILRVSKWLTERLSVLTAVRSMKNLVPAFKGFSETLILLTNMVDKRQLELINSHQREQMLVATSTLTKCVSMLNSTMQTYVKYPDNGQAKTSKDYVVGEILECMENLTRAVENKAGVDEVDEEPEAPGHFVTLVDKALDRLSQSNRLQMAPVGTEFDQVAESSVRHSMSVAHISTSHHRDLIIHNCQRILRQRTHLSEIGQSARENPGFAELQADFDEACERLMAEFQDLERHVNAAVLHLVADTFNETTEPLDRMMKNCLQPSDRLNVGISTPSAHQEAFIDAFHQHSDKLCQVARFVAAASPDSRRVSTIRACVSHMERLDPELVPATVSCRQSPSDRASMEHLRLLKKEWSSNLDMLLSTIDELIDLKTFIDISELDIRADISRTKNSLHSEAAEVADATRSVIGRARRVSQVASKMVESHTDPVYRNGIMVYISQLNKAIPWVKSSANRLVEDMRQTLLHDTYQKRCGILMKLVTRIQEALHGNNLPDLLNPVRHQARSTGAVKALDFGELNDLEDDLGTTNQNPQGKKKKEETQAQLRKESEKKQEIMKKYISDVVHSHLSDLSRAVVSAAVAGQQKRVNLLCNDVLSRCNHITEAAKSIAECIRDEGIKETLQEVASQIADLTPQLLDKSRKVVECDTYQVEPLHHVAEQWASKVSYLESYVDSIIEKWKLVVERVVDAAKMNNVPLLKAQLQHVREHRKFISDTVTAVNRLVLTSSVVSQEKASRVIEEETEVENLTTLMATMADVLMNSGSPEEKQQLEVTARDWASKVFCIATVIDNLACDAMVSTRGRSFDTGKADTREVNREMDLITEETIRLKGELHTAASGCDLSERVAEAEVLVKALDRLCDHMHECARLLTHISAPYQTTEKLYAPQSMSLLQWQWAAKVVESRRLVDDLTAEFSSPWEALQRTADLIESAAAESQNERLSVEYRKSLREIHEKYMAFKTKVLDLIQTCPDLDSRSTARHHLDQLSSSMDQLKNMAKKLLDTPDHVQRSEFSQRKRDWATKCQHLSALLRNMEGVKVQQVTAVMQQLKTSQPTADEHSPVHCKAAAIGSTFSTTGTDIKSVVQVKATSNSSRNQNKSACSRRLLAVSQLQSEAADLTGSLLDFADDLLDSDEELDDPEDADPDATLVQGEDAIFNSTIDSLISTPKSGNTTLTPQGAVVRGTSDLSWKALAAGPKTQHSTPIRSTGKSGYRGVMGRPTVAGNRGSSTKSKEFSAADIEMFPLEAEKWEDDNNAIVRIAKEISQQLQQMIDFTKGVGPLTSKQELIATAKLIAKNGQKLLEFAKILVEYSIDKRVGSDLKASADHIPTVIAQLNILASVKSATPEDTTTEKMLIKTSGNLVEAINKMLRDAEATCVKGVSQPPPDALEDIEAVILATRWKRKFNRHRLIENTHADTDELGLRVVSRRQQEPALNHILLQR